VVAGIWLSEALREVIRCALVELACDPEARGWLDRGRIERFVAVGDQDYDDLRRMRHACVEAGFLTLR
jgi:hypothetical protein